jgi:hypothetical protein
MLSGDQSFLSSSSGSSCNSDQDWSDESDDSEELAESSDDEPEEHESNIRHFQSKKTMTMSEIVMVGEEWLTTEFALN